MLMQSIFPSLFGETAAVSANFLGATVKKSEVNPNCVIISASKPVEWFMDYLIAKGFDSGVIVDRFEWRNNTDNSLSIWVK